MHLIGCITKGSNILDRRLSGLNKRLDMKEIFILIPAIPRSKSIIQFVTGYSHLSLTHAQNVLHVVIILKMFNFGSIWVFVVLQSKL